ncbi:hypothetical protein BYT27DRAFT_7258119 [Phlegmacium glaucopus]|nr:hypothetical protein BYT27DRAFT_7258119 [Phlegmacium glaucopus]
MFANPRNLVITGGRFNNSNVTNEWTIGNHGVSDLNLSPWKIMMLMRVPGIGLLHKHSVPGATHDSGERFDPPKCDANTRILIIQRLTAWVKSKQQSSSMLWLRGSAGVGKSALAQSLAELCALEAILAGTFFFSRTSPNPKRSDGRSVLLTIASQLLSSFPRIRKFVNKTIQDDPSIFDRSLETQMRELIIKPLTCLANSPTQRFLRLFIPPPVRLIIIDGLDECLDQAIQCELLRIIGTSLKKFPFPFRFLIASRPDVHITRTFQLDLMAMRYTEIDLSEEISASSDIHILLRKRFDDIKRTHILRQYIPSSWPSEDEINELVRRSSCQFIYASTVIKYISSPKHQPTERLNVIMGLSHPVKDNPYAQLDALYMHIFSCVDDISTALIILGVLFISMEGDLIATPAKLEKLLFLKQGEVELVLSDLRSVLTVEDQSIRILHASLPDFLLNPSRSIDFYVNLGVSHAALARGYMRDASEVTYDLDSMCHSWDLILTHLNKAVLTEGLHRDLLYFKFTAILRRSNFRIKRPETGKVNWSSTIKFQGYVMHWIWSFLRCIEETEAFKHSKDIYDRHMKTFDEHLNHKLLVYLSHQDLADVLTFLSIYEDGLDAHAISHCIPALLKSATDYLAVTRIDENALHFGALCSREEAGHTSDSTSGQQRYLVMLRCFLQDPKRSGRYFVDGVKYARAAVRCFKVVCPPTPEQELPLKTKVDNPVTLTGYIKMMTEIAFLQCIAALLPRAAIADDLLALLANNEMLIKRRNRILHGKKGVAAPELAAQIGVYLQASYLSFLVGCGVAESATARSHREE